MGFISLHIFLAAVSSDPVALFGATGSLLFGWSGGMLMQIAKIVQVTVERGEDM